MGKQNADWLAKPIKMKELSIGNTVTAKQLTFTVGNMGLIYRGNRCMRTAPFMQTDSERQQSGMGRVRDPFVLRKRLVMVAMGAGINEDNLHPTQED